MEGEEGTRSDDARGHLLRSGRTLATSIALQIPHLFVNVNILLILVRFLAVSYRHFEASQVAEMVKNLPAMQET